ncbi:biotin/lipoyl-containing protein [Microbaculum marinisediminis]|uniref:Lipoyl-binding domain-containing protein n=1 Tax=Microbaculum marinisediminis TaxID=2931392 RepID=A0AAW5R893_9HYPH|nr:biotin/lipoyl-containing protein [Microbaculum sp. A6E488]MCT8974600.1 hypothetical protein [Microbaculum sp. A6E488]
MTHEVIMPALGMAQDTGLIVAWQKAPGDAVAAGDILFEVETDKSTVEVEAGHDGFVAALFAEAGEEAPVGSVIALISAEKPEQPIQASLSSTAAPEPVVATQTTPAAVPEDGPGDGPKSEPATAPAKKPVPAPTKPGGPILASPKARRLAAEQGLELGSLVAAGVPQPYHVADLETLKALPSAAAAAGGAASAHITARVAKGTFTDFLSWLDGQATHDAVWAAFAAASLRAVTGADALVVRVDHPVLGRSAVFADPDLGPLSAALPADTDAAPALILRDLTGSRITGGRFGAAGAPTLTVATAGDDLALTLDFAPDQLGTDAAIALLEGFAGRLDEPLRQLL